MRLAPFGALWFCYFATQGLFSPYSPLWLQSMGLSTLAIGLYSALQSGTRLVAPYAWGWLADHGGRRAYLIRVAAVLSTLAAFSLGWAGNGWMLVLAVALLYLANGGMVPIAETLALKQLHGAQGLDARRYGRIRLWGSVGFIAAVMLGGPLLQWTGVAALPWITCAIYAAVALAAWRLPSAPADPLSPAQRLSIWPVLRRPEVAWFFGGTMLTVLAHTALYAFFSIYLDSLGHSKAVVGLVWGVGVLAEIVFFATQGRWLARGTDLKWLHAVALVTALRFACTAAFGHWLALLLLVQLSHAITFAAHHSGCTSVIARHFPDRLRGRGSALYTTLGYGVPGVLGGIAGGVLVQAMGLESVFWAASAAGLAAALCYRRAMAHAAGQGAAMA